MQTHIYVWKFSGFIFTSAAGVMLHFLYDWSGQSQFIALFSAINESTWEHMKLFFFPMLIFAFVESSFLSDKYENYWQAKFFAVIYGTALIPIFYYLTIGILGSSPGWFNIVIFFMASLGAYWLEIQLIKEMRGLFISPLLSKIFLAALAMLFMLFTFFPPNIPLFQDPVPYSEIFSFLKSKNVQVRY